VYVANDTENLFKAVDPDTKEIQAILKHKPPTPEKVATSELNLGSASRVAVIERLEEGGVARLRLQSSAKKLDFTDQ
jgi:hypothetical protein